MKRAVFDIETDDIKATKVHCISVQDVDSMELFHYPPDKLQQGIDKLKEYDRLIGHNILNFDIPILKKILNADISADILDTLVLSRLFNPTREGGHGLEAWGYRLGYRKIDFDEYEKYTPTMGEYCNQDVRLNTRVYQHLKTQESRGFSKESVILEHAVAAILKKQEDHGFLLDVRKASILVATLEAKLQTTEIEVRKEFKPKVEVTEILPTQRKDGSIGKTGFAHNTGVNVRLTDEEYTEICKHGKVVRKLIIDFNLGSRKQIGEYLQEFGWKPTEYTATGQPVVNEVVLDSIDNIPQAKLIAQYLTLQKRIAQINSWLDAADSEGRVHGYVNPNGAVTGRMTHNSPNMAQVPAVSAPYGKECRACWTVPVGFKLVGIDASGLEGRMLAHHINNAGFTHDVTDGDIHSNNQKALNLESRNTAKAILYAFIYGAGDSKLGSMVGGDTKAGRRIRDTLLDSIPSLRSLVNRIQGQAKRGHLVGIDGRKIFVRSQHAALNSQLQGDGAIVMKQALIIFNQKLKKFNGKVNFVVNVHDEWQLESPEEFADEVGQMGVDSIKEAGLHFNMNCPLDGEYKVGNNWSDTH